MGSYSPCSFALFILVFLFAVIAFISLIAAFICSIVYAIKFQNVIPRSCNSKNLALSVSLAIFIVLFFILLLLTLIITKKYEEMKPFLILGLTTVLLLLIIFILLILIPVYSSDKHINKILPDIVKKILDKKSKCFIDFSKKHDCEKQSDCEKSAETIIKNKIKPIRKSSIILVSITDGSIILAILFLIYFYTPCPCGPVHDLNRF